MREKSFVIKKLRNKILNSSIIKNSKLKINKTRILTSVQYSVCLIMILGMLSGIFFAGKTIKNEKNKSFLLRTVYAQESMDSEENNSYVEYKTVNGIQYKLTISTINGITAGTSVVIGYDENSEQNFQLMGAVISKEGYICMVKEISEYAFKNCKKVNELKIPSSVYYIRKGAFSGCSELTKIQIPLSVRVIEEKAFENCINLEDVGENFEGMLKLNAQIAEDAFIGCSKLILPEEEIITEATDTSAPIIHCNNDRHYSGPGEWSDSYEGIVQITATDNIGIQSITVNGTEIDLTTLPYTLTGGTYEIVAKDTANNITKLILGVKDIKKTANESIQTTESNMKESVSKVPKAKIVFAKNIKGNKIRLKLQKVYNKKYEIKVSTTKKFPKKSTKTYYTSKKFYIIKKLTKGKTYYIRGRLVTKENQKGNFSKWSSVKKIKIKR